MTEPKIRGKRPKNKSVINMVPAVDFSNDHSSKPTTEQLLCDGYHEKKCCCGDNLAGTVLGNLAKPLDLSPSTRRPKTQNHNHKSHMR